MKKILLLLLLLSHSVFAQTVWTVHDVPNTRTQMGNFIHVSDPDGYLSDSTEWMINMALDSIRSQADVFVVTLYTIGDAEPKEFATTLFNYWGIGDADTDNGVLLLFVEDQHALEFETGYGAEETLTDARCSRIFNQTIVPYFREGDYEGGLCAGVIGIVEVFGGAIPVGLRSVVPEEEESEFYDEYDDGEDVMDDFSAFFILFVLLPVPILSFFRWIFGSFKINQIKDEGLQQTYETVDKEGVPYIKDLKTTWLTSVWKKKGFYRFLLYGVFLVALYLLAMWWVPQWKPEATEIQQFQWVTWGTLLVYLTVTCLVQNIMMMRAADKEAVGTVSPCNVYERARNDAHSLVMRLLAPWVGIFFAVAIRKKRDRSPMFQCPQCGHEMSLDKSYAFPSLRALEVKLGASRYKACRCDLGHVVVLQEKGPNADKLYVCNQCHAEIAKKIKTEILKHATYYSTGLEEVTYECQRCKKQYVKQVTTPELVHSSSGSSSSSGGGRSSSGGGGSFGGGRSGGGGYSGRW